MLNCPEDHSALQPVDFLGFSLHPCQVCGGVWFHGSELNKIRSADPNVFLDVQSLVQPKHEVHSVDDSELRCPEDGRLLSKRRYTYDTTIDVAGCQACGGLWVSSDALANSKVVFSKPSDSNYESALQDAAIEESSHLQRIANEEKWLPLLSILNGKHIWPGL